MAMTLMSITAWFTHFLITSALNVNTLPTNTLSEQTEVTQITPSTTPKNQEPTTLAVTAPLSTLTTTAPDRSTDSLSEVHTPPNRMFTKESTSLHQYNSSAPSQNDTMDDEASVNNASDDAMSHTYTRYTTTSTNFTTLTPLNNTSGTMSSVSYNYDGSTIQTGDTSLSSFDSVSTVPWEVRTEKDDDNTKGDGGNYETNSTQATFANTKTESRGAQGTEGSEYREEPYNTPANTIVVSDLTTTAKNDWSTSQSTDISKTTTDYKTAREQAVRHGAEYHTSEDAVNHSTITYRFTNSTAHTERENRTGTPEPAGTTYSTITNLLTVNSTNNKTNKTDTESKVWPKCSDSTSRHSRLVCFITVWTLAMTATIFLGITIVLCVRLSAFKKKVKRRDKGRRMDMKESLWADPKESVQERVEFWYVNGSTLEADKKKKDREREELMKRRGYKQDSEENSLWIQPRVTMDDITDFWYANRRIKVERRQNT